MVGVRVNVDGGVAGASGCARGGYWNVFRACFEPVSSTPRAAFEPVSSCEEGGVKSRGGDRGGDGVMKGVMKGV